jgi:hypothetical protein
LLKHVHNESRGAYSELTANAIRALAIFAQRAKNVKLAN